ncbi:hypothetical protein OIU79_020064 [Salix purpurea]|uniref:Uncharacterized protein n=1 Tax=Salix purpurea TaxID=77065 RepID=A0A9Q0P2Q8_SALPP|nr:hypothetical protein OIU79_020064 [Salix purpurea]
MKHPKSSRKNLVWSQPSANLEGIHHCQVSKLVQFLPPSVKLRIILYFETVSATSTCVNASPGEIELIDIVQHRGCTDRPRKEIVSSAKEHSTEIGTYSC